MGIVVIAVKCHPNKSTKGFRVMDKETFEIMDVTTAQVLDAMRRGTVIEGLKMEAGKIRGSNGNLDRYSKLNDANKLVGDVKGIVILKSVDDVGFRLADYTGKVRTVTKENLLNFLETGDYTLANGKVVDGPNGKFISSISGSYENIALTDIKKKEEEHKKAGAEEAAKVTKEIEKNGESQVIKKRYTVDKVLSGGESGLNILKEFDEKCGMDVEQKVVYMEYVIKRTRPFYYYMMTSLNRKYTLEIPTMAVSLSTFYINPKFVLELSLPELVFVGLHEIMHIAMMHSYRGNGKDHECFNIAADFFVNEHLIDEFNLPRNNDPVKISGADGSVGANRTDRFTIALPDSALVNPNINLKTDTVEALYEELAQLKQQIQQQLQQEMSKLRQQGQQGQGQQGQGQQGQGQQGQGQQGQGQQGQGGQSGQSGQGQGGQSGQSGQGQGGQSGQSGQGQGGQSGQGGSSSGCSFDDGLIKDDLNKSQSSSQGNGGWNRNGQNRNGNTQGTDGNGQVQGSDSYSDSQGEGQNSGSGAQGNGAEAERKGTGSNSNLTNKDKDIIKTDNIGIGATDGSVDGNATNDGNRINGMNDGNTVAGADNKKGKRNESILNGKTFRGVEISGNVEDDLVKDKSTPATKEQARQMAQAVLARAVTMAKKNIKGWSPESGGMIERMVADALAPKVNWVSVLKSQLTLASQKVNTFSAPDKRFRSRGMIMPGPKKLENDTLENVKICIDTSGSISNQEIGIALAQIQQLLKTFKAKAELIYWDTEVRAVYEFKDIHDLLTKKPMGGGGTDANCIFDYFETNKDYKIGKKKKPDIVLVFTDGYFGQLDSAYKKYRGTVWIINNGVKDFSAPFGKVAPFKIED